MISLTLCLLMMTDLVPVQVSTMPFQRFVNETETDFLASLEPYAAVDLHVRVDGMVVVARNPMGKSFRAGQEILAVDDAEQQARLRLGQAELEAREAELRNAERRYQRAKTNQEQGIIPLAELEDAQLTFEKASAEVSRARAALDLDRYILSKHHLTAPFDGVLAESTPEKGRFVTLNQKVGRLLDTSRFRILFNIPANQRNRVLAPDAHFQLVEDPKARLTLHAVAPAADGQTGMIAVELLATEVNKNLAPGSNIRVRRLNNELVVHLPATSVRQDNRGFVFWVDQTTRLSRLDLNSSNLVLSLSNDWKDRPLVVLGPDSLKDGDAVLALKMEGAK